jgi:chemotaxis protein histidine kinase CheA
MYLGEMDADHLEPIFDILFPQQTKDQKHIGFANSMTDFMQNCRSGSVKPWLVTSSDVQAFVEMETFRPPESKRKLASIDELDKLDLAVDTQIVSLLAGCESLAKKNTVTIMDKLEELSKTEPLLGQPVRDYLAQLRTQAKALTEQNSNKRQQRDTTAAEKQDESQSESEEEEEPAAKATKKPKKEAAATAKPEPERKRQKETPKASTTTGPTTALKQPSLEDILKAREEPFPAPRAEGQQMFRNLFVESSDSDEDDDKPLKYRSAEVAAAKKKADAEAAAKKIADAAKAAAKKIADAAKAASKGNADSGAKDAKSAEKAGAAADKEGAAQLAIKGQKQILANLESLTGFKRHKYAGDVKARMVTTRPSDRDAPAEKRLRAYCGQVRRWGYGEHDDTWLVAVGAACPETKSLPERFILHWLKQAQDDVFVLDLGYKGFAAELEPMLKLKHHKDVVANQGLFQVADWQDESPRQKPSTKRGAVGRKTQQNAAAVEAEKKAAAAAVEAEKKAAWVKSSVICNLKSGHPAFAHVKFGTC